MVQTLRGGNVGSLGMHVVYETEGLEERRKRG